MTPRRLFFIISLILGSLFIIGSILKIEKLVFGMNLIFIPSLLLYYNQYPSKIQVPLTLAFVFFYIRDLYLTFGYTNNPEITFGCFYAALAILLIYAITEFKKSKIHVLESLSLLIIFSFSIFLFLSMIDLVPRVIPSYETYTYLYLILLNIFLCLTYTVYILKSHKASLGIMLFSSFLIFSETSLFFKLLVIEDISVSIFYPVCHTASYAALIYYGLNRRNTGKMVFF